MSSPPDNAVRFERIELDRYGKFTDRCIELRGSGTDFHVIVGPNEAGKSTVRAAIADLLFGIPARSPLNFVHAYDDMQLGACIRRGALRQHFKRRKRARNALRDAEDNVLPDELLAPFVGDMDRVAFGRMFCLDHQQLVAGGDELLSAKDDVGALLFEASSGITGFTRLRDALDEEAQSLWDRRRSANRAFYRHHDELKAAEQALKQATVRPRQWREAERRAATAREAFAAATRALEELEARRARLERIRRVAPHLAQVRELESEYAALGTAVRLPRSAPQDFSTALQTIARANAVIERAEKARGEAQARFQAVHVNEACLTHAEAIDALAARRARTEQLPGDISRQQAEASSRIDEVQRIAAQLGWSGDEGTLEAMIPPAIVRAAIQELLQERGRLDEAVRAATQAVQDKEAELRSIADELAECAAEPVPDELRGALDRARALGDAERRLRELATRVETSRERVDRALRELAPWTGSLEDLRSLVLPTEADAQGRLDSCRTLEQRLETLREEVADAEHDIESHELELRQLRQAGRVVGLEELQKARDRRDELWRRIRSAEDLLRTEGDAFEDRLAEADELADLRYANASQVAQLEQKRTAIAQLRLRIQQKQRTIADVDAQLAGLQAEWQARMRAIGLPDASAAQFKEWLARRRSALDAAETLEQQRAERDALAREISTCTAALAAELGVPATEPEGLSALIGRASGRIDDAKSAEEQRKALVRRQRAAQGNLAGLRQRLAQAESDLSRWTGDWRHQIAAARLPADILVGAASKALQLFDRLAELLKEIRDIRRNRIEAMQRELAAFAASAAECAAAVGAEELAGQPPEAIARTLAERLGEARHNAARRDELTREIETRRKEIEDAQSDRREAEARLEPLLALSGASGLEQLRPLIERSERLQDIEASLHAARSACLEAGDGLDLEQLRAEAQAEEVSAIPSMLAAIEEARATRLEERDGKIKQVRDAETELQRCAGQVDAAAAEAQRQEALAALANTADRFVRVFIAARLLRWSLERYREEKQGPLLKRASEIFRRLTLESFERLVVDFDERAPRLKGCRAGGRLVDVEGMSEGTRDQLYLALRLAALETQLDQGRALPFVADDLFINFDDERAFAGFQSLAELATQTQVIFLTHHEHLLPLIERVIGPPLNVVRL